MNALKEAVHRLRRAALQSELVGLTDGELLEAYVTRRQEAAFEALVRRHGAMVLAACRRVLRNEADAEDAFQATFLILVRGAASIKSPGMVGNWLYGVAHKTALKAVAMNRRRRTKEREAVMPPRHQDDSEKGKEALVLLDTELNGLADRYRAPLVLCDLEGRTIREAACHLGWPQGTVATRLRRGRELLAKRLLARGLVLSGGALVLSGGVTAPVSVAAGLESVPPALVRSTVKAAASLTAAGYHVTTAIVPANVAALMKGVTGTMLLTRAKVTSAVLLAAGLLVGGTASFGVPAPRGAGDEKVREKDTRPAVPPGAEADRIGRLVRQLDSDLFEEREQATRELDKIGVPALEALRKAAKDGSPEVQKRAEELIRRIDKPRDDADGRGKPDMPDGRGKPLLPDGRGKPLMPGGDGQPKMGEPGARPKMGEPGARPKGAGEGRPKSESDLTK
jgi:RNA polymerase sigma factor (sigma-70 family)